MGTAKRRGGGKDVDHPRQVRPEPESASVSVSCTPGSPAGASYTRGAPRFYTDCWNHVHNEMWETSMLTLTWIKLTTGHWCQLETVDLSRVKTSGVYIIWHGGNPSRVVRVGQGDIADRLGVHRLDVDVLKYRPNGTLFVTWASVPGSLLDGAERFLAEHWKPLIGARFPAVAPVAVNQPF
jgi:hypothetical protein